MTLYPGSSIKSLADYEAALEKVADHKRGARYLPPAERRKLERDIAAFEGRQMPGERFTGL